MSLGTYSPTLFVGDTKVASWKSINFKDGGNNQVTSLSVSTSDPQLDNMALDGKEITFYLNNGAHDTVPFFRGRIKESKPSNKAFNFTAYDVRILLSGKEALPISITDEKNYDGYTLGQFLYEYIDTVINYNNTLIGLDMLNDSNPTVSLSGFRNDSITPLQVVQNNLKTNKNTTTDVRNTRLVVRDDGIKSNLCFVEEQSIDNSAISFSYSDGLENVSFKRRNAPNVFLSKADGNSVVYKHNNLPNGLYTEKMSGDFSYPDEAVQESFFLAEQMKDKHELSITVTKGHYLDIGNVILLDVPDFEYLSGKHRIVSKNVSVSSNKISCKLQPSKETPRVNTYLSSVG